MKKYNSVKREEKKEEKRVEAPAPVLNADGTPAFPILQRNEYGGTIRGPAARVASTDQHQMRQALAAATACFLRVRPLLRSLSRTNPMASYSSPFAVSTGSPFTALTTTFERDPKS